MILKLAGANGSGKTTLAREFIKHFHLVQRGDEYVGPIASGPYTRAVALGRYSSGAAGGGMDPIDGKEYRLSLVENYITSKRTLVLFEGILVGSTYGALGALSERKPGVPWVYVFLDTPIEVCIERIVKRREARGNFAPFDPERRLRKKFKALASVQRRATAVGHKVVVLSHELTPAKALKKLLKEVGAC
jgi:thymidylate kinase